MTIGVVLAVLAAPTLAAPQGSGSQGSGNQGSNSQGYYQYQGQNGTTYENVCSEDVAPGQARCLAYVRTDSQAQSSQPSQPGQATAAATLANPAATLGDNGAYDPPYLESAYNDPSYYSNPGSYGVGQTVAIVDAYNDPNAYSDLSSYRSYFGLPACAAGTCFRQLNETGGTSLPSGNTGWAEEISLDLDMVSAICPNCGIDLIEANTNNDSDLYTAEDEAALLQPAAISNSWGGGEYSGENSDSSTYFDHPGIAVVAASGDNGYGVEFPAASPDVTAVGGTTLNQATNTGSRSATETVWSGAGSGCSAYEALPTWQPSTSSCAKRTVADASAVANPSTGVWVYDTYGETGWLIFGGTSVATPIISSFYALAANPPGSAGVPASYLYANEADLNKVTSGSNGSCGTYLCNAADSIIDGYNGPTGLGTPNGISAFEAGSVVQTAPSAPQNLTAKAGNASVSLSWSAPSSNGGSSINSYQIYRGTSSGGESLLTTTGTTTSYTDTSVTNGTTYYYKVAATNSVGTGPMSNEASATPTATVTVPGAPTGLTAKTDASRGVDLAWSAPTNTGGASITGYELYRSTRSGRETAYRAVSCTTSTCTYTDTGTTSRTTYYYEVAATNSKGTGSPSNQASARAR